MILLVFWIGAHKSMRAVSVSSPDEKVRLPALPENVDKDVNDWFD